MNGILDNNGRLVLTSKVLPFGNVVLNDFTVNRVLFVGTGKVLSESASFTFDGTILSVPTLSVTNPLDANARVTVRKNTGADVGTRRRLNLIEGANITLTVADDSGSEEVDITIAGTGGGSGDSITINSAALVDANFNDTTPAAPASSINVRWQKDAGSPANVSANTPYAGSLDVSGGNLQLSGDAASPGNTKLYGTDGSGVKGWYNQPTSPVITQTEIDFGTEPVAEGSFVVVDAAVTPTSKIIGSLAYETPTGKDLDELDMDGLDIKFAPGSGQLTIYARGQDGYVADKFKINYQVAA